MTDRKARREGWFWISFEIGLVIVLITMVIVYRATEILEKIVGMWGS